MCAAASPGEPAGDAVCARVVDVAAEDAQTQVEAQPPISSASLGVGAALISWICWLIGV